MVSCRGSYIDKSKKFPSLLVFLQNQRSAIEYDSASLRTTTNNQHYRGTSHYTEGVEEVNKEPKPKCLIHEHERPRLQQTITWRSYLPIHVPVMVYATILTLMTHGWSVTIVMTGITSEVPVCLFWTTWATTWTSLVKCVLKKDFLHTNTHELA